MRRQSTNLTKRVKALEDQLRILLKENEALKKNADSKPLENQKKFEKAIRDKKTEKMMGYVPMRQYSLFEDDNSGQGGKNTDGKN